MDDNYDNFLFRKYTVAVAIAVIKTKPENNSLEEYIATLTRNVHAQNDAFENVSICSLDFFDDSFKDVNMNEREHIHNDTGFITESNSANNICLACNDTKRTEVGLTAIYEKNMNTSNSSNRTKNQTETNPIVDQELNGWGSYSNRSVAILKDDNQTRLDGLDKNQKSNNTCEYIFKEIEANVAHEVELIASTPQPLTESTFYESFPKSQTNLSNSMNVSIHLNNTKHTNEKQNMCKIFDSQETEWYTLHGFDNNFTHISQSQDNTILLNSGKRNLLNSKSVSNIVEVNDNENDLSYSKTQNTGFDNLCAQSISSNSFIHSYSIDEIHDETGKSEANKKTKTYMRNVNQENSERIFNVKGQSQKTLCCESNSPIYKHIHCNNSNSSASGYGFLFKDVIIDVDSNKSSFSARRPDSVNKDKIVTTKSEPSLNNTLHNLTEIQCSTLPRSRLKDLNAWNSPPIDQVIELEEHPIAANRADCSSDQFNFINFQKQNTNVTDNLQEGQTQFILNNKMQTKIDSSNCNCEQFSIGYNTECKSKNNILDIPDGIDDSNSDVSESREDIVTFKVLEELNRVKHFINKQDIRLSDSGRSNSQSLPFKSGSQLSGVRINESGYCLLNFLTNCAFTKKTTDITEEISFVLGQLIDKLHEDENYPQFLEIILGKVQDFITAIYERPRNTEDLYKKDEHIDRLLHLNRSTNVINYTLEKLLPILEEVYLKLKNKECIEIYCIEKTENLCYIFHVLEILLKRYNSAMVLLSQTSTQISQDDDRSFKRSTITEIWRKKWNLSKNEVNEGSYKKPQTVLTQISEILNKIIVQGMEGYSLISFAALQCFNLLQSK